MEYIATRLGEQQMDGSDLGQILILCETEISIETIRSIISTSIQELLNQEKINHFDVLDQQKRMLDSLETHISYAINNGLLTAVKN